MLIMINRAEVSRVLNRNLSEEEFEMLQYDWKAFSESPQKYSNLTKMVNDYLDDFEKSLFQELMENDFIPA